MARDERQPLSDRQTGKRQSQPGTIVRGTGTTVTVADWLYDAWMTDLPSSSFAGGRKHKEETVAVFPEEAEVISAVAAGRVLPVSFADPEADPEVLGSRAVWGGSDSVAAAQVCFSQTETDCKRGEQSLFASASVLPENRDLLQSCHTEAGGSSSQLLVRSVSCLPVPLDWERYPSFLSAQSEICPATWFAIQPEVVPAVVVSPFWQDTSDPLRNEDDTGVFAPSPVSPVAPVIKALSQKRVAARRLVLAKGIFAIFLVFSAFGAVLSLSSDGRDNPAGEAARRFFDGSTVLLMQRDGDRIATFTLFAAHEDGGQVLVIPAGLQADIPDRGATVLGDIGTGPGAAETAAKLVANRLGLRVDHWIETDSVGLDALFGRLGVLPLRVREDLIASQSAVSHENSPFSFLAGWRELLPRETIAYLNALTPRGELARLVRHTDVWKALFAELADDPARASLLFAANSGWQVSEGGAAGAAMVFSRLAEQFDGLRAGILGVSLGEPRDGQETFRLDLEGLHILQSRFPVNLVFDRDRPTLELHTLPEGGGVSFLFSRLNPQDYRLVGSAPVSPGPDQTWIVYRSEQDRSKAETLRATLGLGRLVKDPQRIASGDLTLVVGRDIAGPLAVVPGVSASEEAAVEAGYENVLEKIFSPVAPRR